ncbi:MAG: ABC transporter permease [Oscillospiraceae bacterium]|jgi:ABC-type polysaccharide/polyol phosphate export permease|nr:ABC transporter permease [Oscillospiraceae bacterium]
MSNEVKKVTGKKYLQNFLKYRFLLSELVKKNIKLQYRNSVLGVFWTFLQPLLTMLVLVLVFGQVFGRDIARVLNYPTYLLTGRLIYEFFTQSTKKAMRSIRTNATIVKKVYVPKYIYPLSNIISTFVTFLISLTVLALVMGYYMIFTDTPMRLTPYVFLSVVPIFILLILCLGVGMLIATLEVFFRDFEYLYDVFCTLLFYMTPIFYDVEQMHLSVPVKIVLMANPLYSIVSMFRSCVLFGEMWNWNWFFYAFGISVFFLALGFLVFYKKQDKFILHI